MLLDLIVETVAFAGEFVFEWLFELSLDAASEWFANRRR